MTKGFIYKIVNSRIFITIFVLAILVFGILFAYNKYTKLKTDLRVSDQNQSALSDSLRLSKNKVGELTTSKQILVAQHQDDLKDLNSELLKEVKKFNGKVHELTKIVAEIDHGTTVIDSTKLITLPNGDNGIDFKYSKVYSTQNSRFIEGTTFFRFDSITNKITPLPTVITRDEINFNITQGLRTTSDGKIEMFAKSSYPDFRVKELNSVIIDPKSHPTLKKFTREKKFHFGLYTGYGVTANVNTGKVMTGLQLGAGLTYTIW